MSYLDRWTESLLDVFCSCWFSPVERPLLYGHVRPLSRPSPPVLALEVNLKVLNESRSITVFTRTRTLNFSFSSVPEIKF